MKKHECKSCELFYVDEDNIFCCMEMGCPIRDLKKCPNNAAKPTPNPKKKEQTPA